MKMTLPKKTFRISALLLVVCMISTVMLSGTFAKYTSEFAGEDTALVAKWDLTMTDGTDEFDVSPATADIDLFSHAYDNNILSTAGTDKIIAPGVKGDFILDMTNNSDVAADITFDITDDPTNADVPMEFFIGGTGFPAIGNVGVLNGFGALETELNALDITLDETDGEDTVTVYWRWAFDGTTATAGATDPSDTTLGTDSADGTGTGLGNRTTYLLNIKITATQVAPTE